MEIDSFKGKILRLLLKEIEIKPTVTWIAEQLGLTRVGTWKILKKMEANNLVNLIHLGKGETSAYIISLNWNNQLTEKALAFALTEEAIGYQRYGDTFQELDKNADFVVLYGSSIITPKEANDIDLIIVAKKFQEIDNNIQKIQKAQIKNIHAQLFTPADFKRELLNPAFIDAIRKGIILYGQEQFITFMGGVLWKK